MTDERRDSDDVTMSGTPLTIPPVTGPGDEPTVGASPVGRARQSAGPGRTQERRAALPAWESAADASQSGGGRKYGYGGLWTPPPGAATGRPTQPARTGLATIAVVVLVLVSGSIGAVISAAVHDNSRLAAGRVAVHRRFERQPVRMPAPRRPGTPETADGRPMRVVKVSPALVNIYTTIETCTGRGQAAGPAWSSLIRVTCSPTTT